MHADRLVDGRQVEINILRRRGLLLLHYVHTHPFGDLCTLRFQHLLRVVEQRCLEGLITPRFGYNLRPKFFVRFDVNTSIKFIRLHFNDSLPDEDACFID